MGISNFPNGFQNGVNIRGIPITISYPGKVKWVNNSGVIPKLGLGGSDGNDGSYLRPYGTLNYAVSQCVASRGDIVMVMPGHAETYSTATALNMSVAGVLVVGLGQGDLRPKFTLDTATTTTIPVSAANIAFSNCVFVANFAAIASLFTLTTAKNFALSDCEFRDTSSILNFAAIVTTAATSNAADGLLIERSNFFGLGATSNTCLISMLGTNDRPTIDSCYIAHAAVTGAGLMPIATGKIVTNLRCKKNEMNFVGATSLAVGLIITTNGSTNSGSISDNHIKGLDDTSPILVTASSGFIYFNNLYQANADKSGFLLPAIDS